MSGERRGRLRELQVADVLRVEGYVVYRLAHGAADLVALKAGLPPLLVQVKSTSRAYERFGPADRRALEHEAIAGGAECVLAHWPSRGRLTMLAPAVWPALRIPEPA